MKLIKIKKLQESELINTAVFAALWGLAEISIGTLLHSSKIPFRGAIMSLGAIVILVCAKSVLTYRWSLLLVGAVTAMFRLSFGLGFNITPFIAIMIESIIAEFIFQKMGYFKITAMIAGSMIMIYSFLQGLIMQMVFLGFDIYKIYYTMIIQITNSIGIKENTVLIIIILLPLFHLIFGAVMGSFGFSVGDQIILISEKKQKNI